MINRRARITDEEASRLKDRAALLLSKDGYYKIRKHKMYTGSLGTFLMIMGGLLIFFIYLCIKEGLGEVNLKICLFVFLAMILIFSALVLKELIATRLSDEDDTYIVPAYACGRSFLGNVLQLAYYDFVKDEIVITDYDTARDRSVRVGADNYTHMVGVKRRKNLQLLYFADHKALKHIIPKNNSSNDKIDKMDKFDHEIKVDEEILEKVLKEYVIDPVLLDEASANEFSQGTKIEYKGKIYNYYGYSEANGYIVISSANAEEGFMCGEDFNHMIPTCISHMPLDRKLRYKKIMPDEVEDHYTLQYISEYAGFKCRYSVYSSGRVRITVDSFDVGNDRPRNLPPESEKKLFALGFKTGNEGDNEWDWRCVYINENISLEDERFLLKAYKYYHEGNMAAPFDKCTQKRVGKIDTETDLKSLYKDVVAREKKEVFENICSRYASHLMWKYFITEPKIPERAHEEAGKAARIIHEKYPEFDEESIVFRIENHICRTNM